MWTLWKNVIFRGLKWSCLHASSCLVPSFPSKPLVNPLAKIIEIGRIFFEKDCETYWENLKDFWKKSSSKIHRPIGDHSWFWGFFSGWIEKNEVNNKESGWRILNLYKVNEVYTTHIRKLSWKYWPCCWLILAKQGWKYTLPPIIMEVENGVLEDVFSLQMRYVPLAWLLEEG